MIKATYRDGQFIPEEPVDLPDGQPVKIEPLPVDVERIGIDESEWRDDPEAIADWIAWSRTIEPLEFTPEEEEAIREFDEKMKRFNLEAVRRQMGLDDS